MTKTRFRLRFTFWLDLLKPDEEQLADQIEQLKTDRSFARTIRDGIRLICDLRQGKLDVLFELFPWVRAEFMEYIQSLQPQKSPAELDIQQQLERLEQIMLKQGNMLIDTPALVKMLTNNGTGLKPLQVTKTITAPAFDDDDDDLLVLRKDCNAGNQSAINFIKSAFALNGMSYDEPKS
jgi:hypothetical protein